VDEVSVFAPDEGLTDQGDYFDNLTRGGPRLPRIPPYRLALLFFPRRRLSDLGICCFVPPRQTLRTSKRLKIVELHK